MSDFIFPKSLPNVSQYHSWGIFEKLKHSSTYSYAKKIKDYKLYKNIFHELVFNVRRFYRLCSKTRLINKRKEIDVKSV